MALSNEESLLIVCTALSPFVTTELIVTTNGKPAPAPGAAAIPLPPITNRLAALDDQYNLHSIMDIMHKMAKDCYDRGYDLAIGGVDLIGPKAKATLGDLATVVQASNPI
jgi:hypothetical protein